MSILCKLMGHGKPRFVVEVNSSTPMRRAYCLRCGVIIKREMLSEEQVAFIRINNALLVSELIAAQGICSPVGDLIKEARTYTK